MHDRRWFKINDYELPLDSIPTEYVLNSFFSTGGLVLFAVPMAFAVLLLCAIPKNDSNDAIKVAGLFAALSIPGIVYSIIKLEKFLIFHGNGCRLVIPYSKTDKEKIHQLLDDLHQTKIRLITRRIKMISTHQMADDMHRRLNYYLDNRIIRIDDYEGLVPFVNDAKIKASG